MNYVLHYNRLIERAKTRELVGYSEKHHIVPKCMGGSNAKDNIVRLTPEEHYVAHQLLVFMYPNHKGLLWAAVAMTNGTNKMPNRCNKLYGGLRRQFAEKIGNWNRGRVTSEEAKIKQRAAKLGKTGAKRSDETKSKMSAASKGRPKSEEHRRAMSESRKGIKRQPYSDERKESLSIAIKAVMWKVDRSVFRTDEYREMQRLKMKQIWEERRAGVLPLPKHIKTNKG